jgi:hypothetical protein
VQRGLVMLTCNASSIGWGFALTRPWLKTLLEVANVPSPKELPFLKDPVAVASECGPQASQ